jgi:hypothetical protein
VTIDNLGSGPHSVGLKTNGALSSGMLYANRATSSLRTNGANPTVAEPAPSTANGRTSD